MFINSEEYKKTNKLIYKSSFMRKEKVSYIYYKDLYEYCSSNEEFLDIIEKKENHIKSLSVFWEEGKKNNKDIILSPENFIDTFLKNELKTIRLGNVESRFLTKQVFNKNIVGDFENLVDKNDDFRMRNNAGLYYTDDTEKNKVHKWWCKNTLELLCDKKTCLTSCYLHLSYDLHLLSLLNVKNKNLNNFGLMVDLIALFENKKILLISNGVYSMKKSFEMGLQRVYKIKVPNFSLYTLKTPQTTIGMTLPHASSIETTEWIIEEIDKNFSDFDVALLACGCYGSPLTNLLSKKYNRNIIYMGSMLYTMFGLYSDGIPKPVRDQVYNTEGFVRIMEICPEECKKIENGKYWN